MSDEILHDTEDTTIEPIAIPAKRGRGRPVRTGTGSGPTTARAPQTVEDVALPPDALATLIATIEKLHEKVDQDPGDDRSLEMLRAVLAQHGASLKSALSPENRLSTGISSYNPGGRADPMPRLKRPCYLLGHPLTLDTLTRVEVETLNRFTTSLEVPSKNWKAAILRDAGGGEMLYLSVPYRSSDDLRGINGGLLTIANTILTEGKRPENQDLMLERIAALEAKLAAAETPQPAVATA